MVNRRHIVNNNQNGTEDFDHNSELSIRLLDYISDLLIEPVKEKKSLLLKEIEKKHSDYIDKNKSSKSSYKKDENEFVEENVETLPNMPLEKISANESRSAKFRQYCEPDPRLKKVSKLLEKIATLPLQQNLTKTKNSDTSKKIVKPKEKSSVRTKLEKKIEALIQTTNENSFVQRENQSLRNYLNENFQTLIFEVNNLQLAVPLIKLGCIVNISEQKITPLVGTPDWFLGLVPNERGNLMVVDTQRFLMPERAINDDRHYDYLIVLDNSQWALACHNVGDAKNINASDIRWSIKSSKKPWFAGMVVEYMSALIEVDSLINLLAKQVVD